MKNTIIIFLLAPFYLFAQNNLSQIDSLIASKYNNGPAVSVLISENFRPVYSKIKGFSDIENHLLATDSSKFRIGSITKQFTAIAILKLNEDKKLQLNDTIQKFLPHFPVKSSPITIEHLLTHTSGLREVTELDIFFTQLMKSGCDPDSLVNYFKDYPLEFTPGSKFQYCNSGYHLLGLIIEKASGLSYQEYITKNILAVSDMQNSISDNNTNLISNRASGYEKFQSKIVNSSYLDMSIPFSAGDLLSTTIDLNKWYKTLFEYQIVSKNSLQKAHTPYHLNDGSRIKYGYGWFVDSLQGEIAISHEGGINGFLSSVWFAPTSKTLAVVLSNCMCNPTTNTAKTVLAYAIGKPLKKKKKIQLPLEVLNKYSGTYEMKGENWIISVLNGELYFSSDSTVGHVIYANSENEFYAEEWDSKFIFTENEGKIKLNFIYLGGEITGKKL